MAFDPENFIDKNPQYWANQQNSQFAEQLDRFYNLRSRGQIQPEFRQYALPKSQMVEMRINPQGGLPIARGFKNSALPVNYATGKVSVYKEGVRENTNFLNGGVMGMPQNAPNPA